MEFIFRNWTDDLDRTRITVFNWYDIQMITQKPQKTKEVI